MQLFSNEHFLSSLPKDITKNYSIKSPITINHHNAIFTVEENITGQTLILKILDKKYYHKSLYQKIFTMTDSYLLLPEYHTSDSSYICSLYPKMSPLPEILCTKGIHYPMIHDLFSDIGKAIRTLHSHKILHLDITPNNIFMNTDGHFYLGDFSSSQFAEKNFLLSLNKCCRTGCTQTFAPPPSDNAYISYWNDCYSFTLLLYVLCNYGHFPGKKENSFSPFYPLLSSLEKTLHKPDFIHQNLINELTEKAESLFTLYEVDTACSQYHFQIDYKTFESLSISTLENVPAKISKPQLANTIHSFTRHICSIPAPLYGLLFLCSFIFIFSLYHHISKRNTETASFPSENVTIKNISFPSAIPPTTAIPSPSAATNSKKENILNLSKIHCQNNSFQAELSNSPSITILFANHCNITNLTLFSNMQNIEELYLFDNHITIPSGFHKFPRLRILILSKNNITSLTPLSKITSLATLDLSHNHHLRNITSLASLKNLNTLILTNTNAAQKEINYLKKKLPDCMIYY